MIRNISSAMIAMTVNNSQMVKARFVSIVWIRGPGPPHHKWFSLRLLLGNHALADYIVLSIVAKSKEKRQKSGFRRTMQV
jgi:hypothetical protein